MTTRPLRTPAIAAAAAASLALAATAQASVEPIRTLVPDTLTVCAFTGFPPTSYSDARGNWKGHDADFLRGFASSRGLALSARESTAFDGIWRRPGSDECDVAAAGITITDARASDARGATFSAPYHSTLRAFVVRRGTRLTGVGGLAGKTVLVGKGTIAEEDVRTRVKRARIAGVRIRYGGGEQANRRAVLAGQAFTYETDDLSAEQAARSDHRLAVAWVHPRMTASGRAARGSLGYPVRTASTGLVQALNAYIAVNKGNYGR